MLPIRIGPSHRSEMGSQILFGEKYIIIDRSGTWIKVKTIFDNYTGWIDGDHHTDNYENDEHRTGNVITERVLLSDSNNNNLFIEPGSEVYSVSDDLMSFTIGKRHFEAANKIQLAPLKGSIIETSERYINSPYLWGGRLISGMDCSGFTQLAYKLHGINIPRDSFLQAEAGTSVSFLDDARPGDLLFFDNKEGRIDHTGIFYEKGKIIHCSGKVRIDLIDHQGIYRSDMEKYSHKLRLIKRIII